MATSNPQAGREKRPYAPPALTVYGSVRDLTGAASGIQPDSNGTRTPSDPAYKQNAIRIGEHAAGFGLYLFDYKPEFREAFGHGRKFGVMADEVEKIVPEAVVRNDEGYRCVDYARLGIRLS